MALAERAEPKLIGPEQVAWLDALEIEHDNLRTALDYCAADVGSAEKMLRLAGTLGSFWMRKGHFTEGRGWLETALAHSSDVPPSTMRKCIPAAAFFAWRQGDYTRATELSEQGINLSRELGDKPCLAYCLYNIGVVALHKGDYVQAAGLFGESLILGRELGDKIIIGWDLYELGLVALGRRDMARGEAFLTECLSLFKEAGDIWANALIIATLGRAAFHNRDYQRAVALYTESLTSCRDMGGKMVVTADCLEGLASAACAQGSFDRAARIFGTADVLSKALGLRRGDSYQADVDKFLAHARTALGETAFVVTWAEGRAMTLEQAIEYALTPETG